MPRLIESILVFLVSPYYLPKGTASCCRTSQRGLTYIACRSSCAESDRASALTFSSAADRCLVACLPVCQRTILLCSRSVRQNLVSESECKGTAFFRNGNTSRTFFFKKTTFFLPHSSSPYIIMRARKKIPRIFSNRTTIYSTARDYILFAPRLYTLWAEST